MSSATVDTMDVNDFLCFELPVSEQDQQTAIQIALEERPQNALCSSIAFPDNATATENEDPNIPSALAVNISKMWSSGRTLRIKFLSGNIVLRRKVKKYAEVWLQYANLKFNWVDDSAPKAEIRIDFVIGGGSWSRLGTGALQVTDQKESTMNLEITANSSDELIRRKVLHEFGHVLGCEHEHQSPLATYVWNEKLIYEELSKAPNRWSRATIKHNVLNRLQAHEARASAFDPDSIMLYEYPSTWFLNGDGKDTKNNTVLSKRDKEWVGACYPPFASDIGQFSTLQVRAWDSLSSNPDRRDVAFEPPYSAPPHLALGLTWLDIDYNNDISVSAVAEDVFADNFTISIAPGPDSRVFSAACSWLEVSSSESDIFTGEFDLASAWPSGQPQGKTEVAIKFPFKFDDPTPPKVVCWFSGLSLGKDSAWRIKTYATDASQFKFRLHVDATPDTDLRGARVTWLAFPREKEGYTSGTFSTDDIPGPENTGTIEFNNQNVDGKGFETTPQLMMAISGLDFESGHNLRLRLSSSALSKTSLTWHMDSWLDSVMNSATGSYVAICAPTTADDQ